MPTSVRSFSKINLGLAIGPTRADGLHTLLTVYQTMSLHDRVTVSAQPSREASITVTSNDPRVPGDARNTAWKMVSATLEHCNVQAQVSIYIEKQLPVQGGMGAGSGNAAAALLGLERELQLEIGYPERLRLAAGVGSDVPLFLVGGTILGSERGEVVQPLADVNLGGQTEIPCVIALPGVGVSTPAAFRRWDERVSRLVGAAVSQEGLQKPSHADNIEVLSRSYSSVFRLNSSNIRGERHSKSGATGIIPDPSSQTTIQSSETSRLRNSPEKLHGLSCEQLHVSPHGEDQSEIEKDLAENSLLALVRTGIENDFEQVVFLEYPSLRAIKRKLMGIPAAGNSAIYAALSGSGSALFGLYRSRADAQAAQQRVQQHGVRAIVTSTMPRSRYWSEMFAE